MIRTLSIRKKILLSFLVVLLPIAGLGVNNYIAHKKIEGIIGSLKSSHDVQLSLEEISSNLARLLGDAKNIDNISDDTTKQEHAARIIQAAEKIKNDLSSIAQAQTLNDSEAQLLEGLYQVLDEFLGVYHGMVDTHLEYRKQRKDLMDVVAKAIQANVQDVKTQALLADSQEILVFTDKVLQDFFTAQVMVLTFIQEPDDKQAKDIETQLKKLTRSVSGMKRTATTKKIKDLVSDTTKNTTAFSNGFKGFSKTALKRHAYIYTDFPALETGFTQKISEFLELRSAANEITVTAQDIERKNLLTASIILSIIMFCLGTVLSVFVGNQLSSRILALVNGTRKMAQGDYNVPLPMFKSRDELTEMVKALEVFKKNAREKEAMEQRQSEEHELRAKIAQEKERAIENFQQKIADIIRNVDEEARNVQKMSDEMKMIIDESAHQASCVSAEVLEATQTVQSVAEAAGLMSGSIRDITQNLANTAQIANDCSDATKDSQAKLDELQYAVNDISSIIEDINKVAEQTNLLALNATIESARAGDAGKGFAVVANEVKELAQKTHEMTDEISQKVAHIRSSTSLAISSVASIMKQIQQVDDQTASVSNAVENQNQTTQEISHNIQEVAIGTQKAAHDVAGIQNATSLCSEAIREFTNAAKKLTSQSENLKACVHSFLTQVSRD